MNNLHIRVLHRAMEILGGGRALATHLRVPAETVLLWSEGREAIPAATMDKLLDVLVAADGRALAPEAASVKGRVGRVLIIDDEPAGAYALARIVKQLGYEVQTCMESSEALAVARRFQPDVVFIDLRMPGADGVEVARALKAEGLGGRIVAATAFTSELQRARTAQAGFAGHLVKPVDKDSVERILSALN